MLGKNVANTVACSIISTRLDDCNSLLYGTSVRNVRKLQRIQNSLARVVSGVKKREHIRPVLKDLHWLPVAQSIDYKVALLTHKILSTGQPTYLHSLIKEYKPTRPLRSEGQRFLARLSELRSALAGRSFTRALESMWNTLPDSIRKIETTVCFKKKLKTYLFGTVDWI